MKTVNKHNLDPCQVDRPGQEEVKIALNYIAREALKLGMPLVANLIGAAEDAVDLYSSGAELSESSNSANDTGLSLIELDKSEMGSC